MLCGCRAMYVSSVVLYSVRAVRDSHLKKRLTNDDQWKERHAVTRLMFLTGSICCPLFIVATLPTKCRSTASSWARGSVICAVLRRTVVLKIISFETIFSDTVRARSKSGRRQYCTCQSGFNQPSEDFMSTQPLRRRSLATKGPVHFQAASLGICDLQSGSNTEFSPSTSVLPCLFDPSYAKYTLVYHQRYIISVIPTSNLK